MPFLIAPESIVYIMNWVQTRMGGLTRLERREGIRGLFATIFFFREYFIISTGQTHIWLSAMRSIFVSVLLLLVWFLSGSGRLFCLLLWEFGGFVCVTCCMDVQHVSLLCTVFRFIVVWFKLRKGVIGKTIVSLMYLLVIVGGTFIFLVVHMFVGVLEVWIRVLRKWSFSVLSYIWLFLYLVELSFFISFRFLCGLRILCVPTFTVSL